MTYILYCHRYRKSDFVKQRSFHLSPLPIKTFDATRLYRNYFSVHLELGSNWQTVIWQIGRCGSDEQLRSCLHTPETLTRDVHEPSRDRSHWKTADESRWLLWCDNESSVIICEAEVQAFFVSVPQKGLVLRDNQDWC